MAPRILDPSRFILSGAIIDWASVAHRQQPNAPLAALAQQRGLKTAAQVQLRWMLDPKLGLPTQPFQVWQRRHGTGSAPKPITDLVSYNTFFAWTAYGWGTPLAFLQGMANSASGVLIIAYAGAPYASAVVGFASLAAGTQVFRFSGGGILSLLVVGNATLSNLAGFDGDSGANDPSWQKLEIVGLPIRRPEWTGVFGWDQDQGMNAAPMPPVDAALDRYRRGAPFFGWPDPIAAGQAAPPWVAAEPKAIVAEMQADMLTDLRKMILNFAPAAQIDFRTEHALPLQGGAQTAQTSFSPISTLMLGVSSDPQSSLIAGFGTAYPHTPQTIPGAVVAANISFDDYMVTALYEKGLDGQSAPVEYAAIVCMPGPSVPPPAPGNLVAPLDGLASPDAVDGRYRALARMMWDLVPQTTPFRVASYAAARFAVTPPGAVVPLMQPRRLDPGKALQPISATTSQVVADATGQLRASDETYRVDPAAAPNTVRYAIAHQDLFGVWSSWATADAAPADPPVQRPRLLSARFDLAPPPPAPGSVCAASLVLDLSWDWTVRRPKAVTLVGRLYAASKPGEPPANLAVPPGLPTSFPGGAGAPLVLTFNGADAPGLPGGSVTYISDDAKSVQPTPVVVAGPRRYRITIPGFQLNFAAADHIGLAIWAQGQEQLAPQPTGAWTVEPLVASASDPRPPVITAQHEDVQLASLPDARGEHRARLVWDAMPGAAGYFVYHATESKYRIGAGLGEPPSDQTLSDRLLALRNAFEAKPLRDPFTRLNSTAMTGASTEVLIERGSKEIHLYLVLGTSAGLIESGWPNLSDANGRKRFQAFAAPQVVPPTTPRLEVVRSQAGASFRAKVVMTTRPGAKVTRLDLFRTRVPEASLELDTMGPAVARITGTGPVWHVDPTTSTAPGEAQVLGAVAGLDTPGGGWKRVYYRAVAISGDDPPRAVYGGRSGPTGAVWVIVPPDGPPDASALAADWPGGPLETVRFTFTSPVPVPDTDLGAHRLRVEAFTVAADGTLAPLFAWPPAPPGTAAPDDRLAAVPSAAQPAPGFWRNGSTYRLLLTRPHLADAVRVRVLLTDPLGRATERVLDSPGGSPLPAPDILSPLVQPSPPARFILGFSTDALFTTTPLGPYTLGLRAMPRPTIFNPHPLPITQTTALPLIQALQVGNDPFTDAAVMPLRRQGAHVAVYLRAALVSLQVTMTAPDGRTAQATMGVP